MNFRVIRNHFVLFNLVGDDVVYNGTPMKVVLVDNPFVQGIVFPETAVYVYKAIGSCEYFVYGILADKSTNYWLTQDSKDVVAEQLGFASYVPPYSGPSLKFVGPTDEIITSIFVVSEGGDPIEYYRNPAWDISNGTITMRAWAIPKRVFYTEEREPSLTDHLWVHAGGLWVDATIDPESRAAIVDVRSDAFTTLSLRAGANVEVSDDGVTFTTWTPTVRSFEADVTLEGVVRTIQAYRDATFDDTIGGVAYYAWDSKDGIFYTTLVSPIVTSKVYQIDIDVIDDVEVNDVTEVGAVTSILDTHRYYDVRNGIVYVRAKTGSTPLYGFSGLYYRVEGKVMSLVDYENVDTCILAPYQFANIIYYAETSEAGLFYDITSTFLENSSSPFLSDASGLILPSSSQVAATSSYALSMMFDNCLTLGTAGLPALTTPAIAQGLYDCFYFGCISLKSIPEHYLDATFTTTPGIANYSFMFSQCLSLETVPEGLLNTSYLGGCFWSDSTWGYQSAYTEMFSNCYSLRNAPALPATTLTPCCYGHMFMNCYALEVAPELNAMALQPGCYKGMFEGCDSLVECPELPATLLVGSTVLPDAPADEVRGVYQNMFRYCTSIEDGPALTALTLTANCYQGMFTGCGSLRNFTCLATDAHATDCTRDWLESVSESGVYHSNSQQWVGLVTESFSGIPYGWTIAEDVPTHLYVYYQPENPPSTNEIAFVRTPDLDDWKDGVLMYAYSLGAAYWNVLYLPVVCPASNTKLWIKDEGEWVESSTATINTPIWKSSLSFVIENTATSVGAAGIEVSDGTSTWRNNNTIYCAGDTTAATIDIDITGTGWCWDDTGTSETPRTKSMGSMGVYLLVRDIS